MFIYVDLFWYRSDIGKALNFLHTQYHRWHNIVSNVMPNIVMCCIHYCIFSAILQLFDMLEMNALQGLSALSACPNKALIICFPEI